jgi:opacity protein-like surface antigen
MKIKHFCFTIMLTVTILSDCSAQDISNYISAGYGFPNLPRMAFNYLDTENKFESTGTGPLHLKYENRIKPWLGVGLSINHMTYSIKYNKDVLDTALGRIVTNHVKVSNNNTAFNARVNFHLINPEKNDKIDVYFGIGIGYRTGKFIVDSEYPDDVDIKLPYNTALGLESTFGFRYFIDENLGVYTELGIAKSVIQFGAVMRI